MSRTIPCDDYTCTKKQNSIDLKNQRLGKRKKADSGWVYAEGFFKSFPILIRKTDNNLDWNGV